MSTHVVVEGESGCALLRRILLRRQAPLSISCGGGNVESASLARSIAMTRGVPVALVLDSDSVDEEMIAEQEQGYGSLLRVAHVPSRLVLAVPEVEIVLFHECALLERILGVEITGMDWLEGRFQPRKVLLRLLAAAGHTMEELPGMIDDAAAERLAGHPVIRQVEDFVAAADRAREPELVRKAG